MEELLSGGCQRKYAKGSFLSAQDELETPDCNARIEHIETTLTLKNQIQEYIIDLKFLVQKAVVYFEFFIQIELICM
jgi:hypothetical protein